MTMSPAQREELEEVSARLFRLASEIRNPVEAEAVTRVGNLIDVLRDESLAPLAVVSLLDGPVGS